MKSQEQAGHDSASLDERTIEKQDRCRRSAAQMVEFAAYRIDLEPERVQPVLDRLEEEAIREEWQLQFLDSINFETMGFPLGLVASVRSCLEDKQNPEGSYNTCRTSVASSAFDEFLESSEVDQDAVCGLEVHEEDPEASPRRAQARNKNRRAPLPPRRQESMQD
eukprot:Nitzschia sp. Nitz4//scaffold87_size112219//39947//40441//NITZ4_004069-RA/size112219-processed-gene-0.4-mRNA-1//1//CDS//3329559354//1958//frame0